MAKYVDGFVIPVPQKGIKAYLKIARMAGKVWMEYGALEYRECVIDDPSMGFGRPFPKLVKVKPGEVVVFSWITYRSKAHRDRVNAKVMKDPRIRIDPKTVPFDGERMSYGGFKTLVDLTRR